MDKVARDTESVFPILQEALRRLRQWCAEVGDYHANRPEIVLADGTYLQPQLEKAADGGEILGAWRIDRRENLTGRLVRRYPV